MATGAAVLELNQIMNVIDPPKDLDIGRAASTLKTEPYKSHIKKAIENLFGKVPDRYTVVGDDKGRIIESVQRRYELYFRDEKNQIEIQRPKHSSGHDARPDGLYFAQDNLSLEVVSNPKLIITPGSILDPAGKTKVGAQNLIAGAGINTLPHDYLVSLSMGDSITGDIEFSEDYQVTIPTKMGVIKAKFDPRTFAPLEGDGSDYFKGNETKNAAIMDLIDRYGKEAIQEIMKYILVKELGDTLQVQWLNFLFDSQEEIQRTNTVVGTTDTVVCYRSIVNKVGVIWTNKGKTTYFLPFFTNAAAQAAINKSFVETIRKEVISHNLSVILLLEKVRAKPRRNSVWVNGQTWNEQQHTNAIEYLGRLITNLTNINKDLDIYFNALADPDAAKNLASRSHFSSPFVWYASGEYYKSNNKVIYLMEENKINFRASAFQPSRFSEIPSQNLFQSGGRRQRGGARRTVPAKANAASYIRNIADADRLINESIEEMSEPYYPRYSIPKEIVEKANRDMNNVIAEEYDTTVWLANDINTNYFLYCYIREFHPEIFTYAFIIKDVIQRRKAGFLEVLCGCGRGSSEYKLVTFDLANDYDVDYYWNDNPNPAAKNRFITRTSPVGQQDNAYSATRQAIRLAMVFTDSFPALLTPQLARFFALLKALFSRQFPRLSELVQAEVENVNIDQTGGGDTITQKEYDEIASEAIDNYEVYYSLKIRAVYEGRDLKENEYERSIFHRTNILSNIYKNIQTKKNTNQNYPTSLRKTQSKQKKRTEESKKRRPSQLAQIRRSRPYKNASMYSEPRTPIKANNLIAYGGKRKTRRVRNKKSKGTRKH